MLLISVARKTTVLLSLTFLLLACKTEQTKIQEQLKATQDTIQSLQAQLKKEYEVIEKNTAGNATLPSDKYLQLKQRYDSVVVMNDSLLKQLQSFENK